MSPLHFLDREAMIAFLGSRYGLSILREAADEFYPPYIARQKVLVKAYRDGLVEVYADGNVDARIVLLGRSVTFPEHEIQQEELTDYALPYPYRVIHWPGYRIAAALRGMDRRVANESHQPEAAGPSGASGPVAAELSHGDREVRMVPEEIPSTT